METTILLDMLGSTTKVQVRRMGLLEALVMVSEPDRRQSRFEAQFMTSLRVVLVVCQVLDVSTSLRVFGRNCKAFIAGRSLEILRYGVADTEQTCTTGWTNGQGGRCITQRWNSSDVADTVTACGHEQTVKDTSAAVNAPFVVESEECCATEESDAWFTGRHGRSYAEPAYSARAGRAEQRPTKKKPGKRVRHRRPEPLERRGRFSN